MEIYFCRFALRGSIEVLIIYPETGQIPVYICRLNGYFKSEIATDPSEKIH